VGNNNTFQINPNTEQTAIRTRLEALDLSYSDLKIDLSSIDSLIKNSPKRVESIILTTYSELEQLCQKLEIWAMCFANKKGHPNIIKTIGYNYRIHGEEGSSHWHITFFLVIQVFNETLEHYQKTLPMSFQNSEETIELYNEIKPALSCIHKNHSYHGSLSPSKIYLRDGHWNIGFSIESFEPALEPVYQSDKLAKTPKDKWHELHLIDQQNGDDFALGMILLKMYSGQNIFGEFTANPTFKNRDQKIIDLVKKIVYKYKENKKLVDLILGMIYKGLDVETKVKIDAIMLEMIRQENDHSNSSNAELISELVDVTGRLPSSHYPPLHRYIQCNDLFSSKPYE